MCNMYRDVCFSQKDIYNWVKHGFATTVHGVETHWLSGKEKVLGTEVSKEGHADSVLVYEKICKQCYLSYLPNEPCIHIYIYILAKDFPKVPIMPFMSLFIVAV